MRPPFSRSPGRYRRESIAGRSKLLVNVSSSESAPESAALALEAGADGVHLAGTPLPGAATSVRKAFRSASPIISVPCHSLADIDVACGEQVDLILFSPVFEKLSAGFAQPPRASKACASLARRRAEPRSWLWAE